MESINGIWKKFLLGIATLIISHIGNPTPANDRVETKTDDNDSDYHLFI
jgi:hypothetical protein